MNTITAGMLYDWIDAFAPFQSAMDFDNPGLLVGDREDPVERVLFALDITPEVVREAAEFGAQLIISHHPVIFNPLKHLSRETAPYLLAQFGIDALCAHTNLDMAPGGVNTALAGRLQLQNVRTLSSYSPGFAEALLGELPAPLSPKAFAQHVKTQLGCSGVRFTDGGRPVRTVGLCSGGGEELVYAAAKAGCEGFVTGESKHHLLLFAKSASITFVDAGYFSTEDVVLHPLMERLQAAFPALLCKKSTAMQDPSVSL